jgi:7-cyano-7-deazaguanine synthase
MKFIHLFSGGLDSTVLIYAMLDQGAKVHCLLFNYGQRHAKELDFAQATCIKLDVPYEVLELPHQLFTRSSLTGGTLKVDELKGGATVVPNRNMVMLSMAASFALSTGATAVSWAANGDDAAIYPDCRYEFYKAVNGALRICDDRRMEIHAPYIGRSKRQVVEIGRRLNVPFDETWSCYAGEDEPCGVCGACEVRKAALA